ncbi:MAG TPA: alkaline phosphatase family protein [Thermoleophilaceae bacterium]|nr:alkaline phosphatase family protein [Thermoleophilaceae bacterium]
MSARKLVVVLSALLSLIVLAAPAQAKKDRPSRVLMIVLDQARPDTIERYGMKNVQKLQHRGKNFPNALVGHMAAETVISHNVLTSGLFPKHMGWSNEVYRDVGGVLGAAGSYHITSSMSCAQFRSLIDAGGYPKLQDYLDQRFGEAAKFASIAQKRTSACTAGHTSSGAGDGTATDPEDIIFQIRGDRPLDSAGARISCDGRPDWRKPESGNGALPLYFNDTQNCTNRWWTWQQAGAYGTGSILPAAIYPLDGNRFVPGFDPAHIGGDNWSADAVIRVIDNDPNWRGMMVSLGAIDKMGHMWGPEDNVTGPEGSDQQVSHLPFAAKNADEQVGRIVAALKARGQLKDTLIVITADHAAHTGRQFNGRFDLNSCNASTNSNGIRSDCNWYFGQDADERYLDPSPAVAQLRDALAGNLAFSYQDGHVAAWLHDNSLGKKQQAAGVVLTMPGVIAAFRTNAAQNDYELHGTNQMGTAERDWFLAHGEELVDTMAHPSGPDVVGLVATDVTYGVMGDHGGHNELIQEVPMVFAGPRVNPADSRHPLRHVDVVPTILEAMGIEYDEDDFDGEATDLSAPGRGNR